MWFFKSFPIYIKKYNYLLTIKLHKKLKQTETIKSFKMDKYGKLNQYFKDTFI